MMVQKVKVKTKKNNNSIPNGNLFDFGQSNNDYTQPYSTMAKQDKGQNKGPGFWDFIYNTSPLGMLTNSIGGLFGGGGSKPKPKPKAPPAPTGGDLSVPQQFTFMDALKQAQDYFNQNGMGQPSVDYSPLIAQTRKTYGDASNRLLSMYQALHNNFQGDASGIGGLFDQAKADTQASAKGATDAINQAYNNARQDQTNQFNALGIGDALANIVSNGAGTTTEDQANHLAQVAASSQASQNQLNANKSAALNYNTGIANSALQGGTDRAANLQNQLAQAIAQIQQQQQQANMQVQQANQGGITSLANDIYNSVLSGQKLSNDQYSNDLANAKLQQQALQQQINQAIKLMTAQNGSMSPQDALKWVLQSYGQ